MHGVLRFVMVSVAAALIVLLCGCNKDKNPPADAGGAGTTAQKPADATTPAEKPADIRAKVEAASQEKPQTQVAPQDATSVFLKDVVVAWRAGQKDGAAKMLASINWKDPTVFKGIEVLNTSQQQFQQLSTAQKQPLVLESQAMGRDLQELGKYMMAMADKASEAGDKAKASACCQAVIACGARMQKPDQLRIMQLVGRSMETTARDKLSSLK